jgi:protein-arginine kinase
LQIVSLSNNDDIGAAYSKITTVYDQLSKILEFAYDEHLGFVSTNPVNLGNGLRVSVKVSIP